jgi:hypothetical protein
MSRIFTQNISDTECIGDSLSKINSNSGNLDTAVQSLSGGSIGGNISLYGANRSITNINNFALSFGTNNAERVRISNSGNVGIGTTVPNQRLTVTGNISATGNIFGTAQAIADNTVTETKITSNAVTPAKLSQPLTLRTGIDTSSGSFKDFTSIPSWVKRITIMFDRVSTTGTGGILVQLGTSSGIQTTNYNGANGVVANSNITATSNISNAFSCSGLVAASVVSGTCVLNLLDPINGTWIATMMLADSNLVRTYNTCGSKTLAGTLDRIRVSANVDSFDAGSVNIMYEG